MTRQRRIYRTQKTATRIGQAFCLLVALAIFLFSRHHFAGAMHTTGLSAVCAGVLSEP